MIGLAAAFVYTHHNDGAYARILERLTIASRLVWIFLFSVKLMEAGGYHYNMGLAIIS